MAITITSVLNDLNENGFFSYVLPFILIFAVVFALLEKTKLFGRLTSKEGDAKTYADTKSVSAVIAAAIGLLSLQLDVVSIFFANIFPKFGVGLAVFVVLLIFLGFFYETRDNSIRWIGWLVGIGVVVWAISNWDTWFMGYYGGFGYWIEEYFWALVILAGLVGVVIAVRGSDAEKPKAGAAAPVV